MGSVTARGIVIFSGGSAANNLVDVFNEVTEKRQSPLNYVIPISDNGGSSSELIRVFGGPGIGDIRSTKPLKSDSVAKQSRLLSHTFAWRYVLVLETACLVVSQLHHKD